MPLLTCHCTIHLIVFEYALQSSHGLRTTWLPDQLLISQPSDSSTVIAPPADLAALQSAVPTVRIPASILDTTLGSLRKELTQAGILIGDRRWGQLLRLMQATALLDGRLAVDIDLFSRGGMRVLDKIGKQDYDVLSRRPAISKAERVALLLGSIARRAFAGAA
jgi:hypothetical protein